MSFPTIFGMILASALTLAIFSRAFGPNALFRWATHLLLGAGAGYVAAVVFKQTLLPSLDFRRFLTTTQYLVMAASLILSVLLVLRFVSTPHVRAWGLLPLGVLAGVGGALALAGAARGSLAPQLMAVEHLEFLPGMPALDVFVVVAATLTSLGVLLYLLPDPHWRKDADSEKGRSAGVWFLHGWRLWGYWVLMLAIGALLASTAGARVTLLIDRVQWLLGLWF